MKASAPGFRWHSETFPELVLSGLAYVPNPRSRCDVVLDPETRWAFEGPARDKRLERRDGVEMVASSSPDGEDVKCGVKRQQQQQEKKLAVVVSGRVSNFQAIYKVNMAGLIRGEVVVVTEKSGCAGAVFARDTDILVLLFPEPNKIPMRCLQVTWLLLSGGMRSTSFSLLGYLKLIPIESIKSSPKSIINTHPFLLPTFGRKGYYGMKVHDSVIASGAS